MFHLLWNNSKISVYLSTCVHTLMGPGLCAHEVFLQNNARCMSLHTQVQTKLVLQGDGKQRVVKVDEDNPLLSVNSHRWPQKEWLWRKFTADLLGHDCLLQSSKQYSWFEASAQIQVQSNGCKEVLKMSVEGRARRHFLDLCSVSVKWLACFWEIRSLVNLLYLHPAEIFHSFQAG